MKKQATMLIATIIILFNSCTNGQTQNSKTNLSAIEFAEKISELPTATIVDVRTPGEFSKGHLRNSNNFDWNAPQKSKTIRLSWVFDEKSMSNYVLRNM